MCSFNMMQQQTEMQLDYLRRKRFTHREEAVWHNIPTPSGHLILSISVQLPLGALPRDIPMSIYKSLKAPKFLITHSAPSTWHSWRSTEDFTGYLVMVNWAAAIFQSNKTCRLAPAVRRAGAELTADVQHLNESAHLLWQIHTNTDTPPTICCPPGLQPTLSSTMNSVCERVLKKWAVPHDKAMV